MSAHEPQTPKQQIREFGICLFCLFIVVPLVSFVLLALSWGMSLPDRSEPTFSLPTETAGEVSVGISAAGPVNGHTLFLVHCASCHGDSGDGKGTRELDRPARSFLAGGFSFGDTEESITRVVRSGIGGTPMPGFSRTLSSRQINAVVKHVRSLLPERTATNDADSIMHVGSAPVVVRGKLPEVYLGMGDIPHGIVVGNPDGMSLMYRSDDVRFLGTRQGAFVKRSDWDGRGGTSLELQGRLIHLVPDVSVFEAQGVPLRGQLAGTDVGGARGVVHYAVGQAEINESGGATTQGPLAGYQRRLEVRNGSGVQMRLPSWRRGGLERIGGTGAWTWWQEPAFEGRMHFVGVRGAQPLEGGLLQLPKRGTVEIVVFPDTAIDLAAEAGLPMKEEVAS